MVAGPCKRIVFYRRPINRRVNAHLKTTRMTVAELAQRKTIERVALAVMEPINGRIVLLLRGDADGAFNTDCSRLGHGLHRLMRGMRVITYQEPINVVCDRLVSCVRVCR